MEKKRITTARNSRVAGPLLRRVLVAANVVIAVAYLYGAFIIGYGAIENSSIPVVTIVIVGVLFLLALGHLRMSSWALKSSAALCGGANILALGYLLPYESALVPPLSSRVLTIAALTVLTALMAANYYLSRRMRLR